MDDDRFWVKSLTLENFRCFEKTELGPFDPHFNLLVGANGTGKSSVLLALAGLFRELASPDGARLPRHLISTDDVRLVHRLGVNGIPFQKRCFPLELNAKLEETISGETFNLSSVLNLKSGPSRPKSRAGRLFDRIAEQEAERSIERPFDERPLPIIALYTTTRGFSASKTVLTRTVQPLRHFAFANWLAAGASAGALIEWFKDQTLEALQQSNRKLSDTHASYSAPQIAPLNLIANAISKILADATAVEFDSSRRDIVVQFASGERKEFSSMSDGQRAVIGLIADIARRACLLNASFLGSRTLEQTTGLVLIDEIDLHLHPKWQRRIVGALKEIFPKIQFFATTHSPQVIGECQPNEIVLLTEDGKQERPSRSFGMDSRWVLECIMRAEGRDPGTAARIAEMFRALDEGRFDDAKRAVEDLRETIGDDRDVAAVDAYLWNLGHEGEEAAE